MSPQFIFAVDASRFNNGDSVEGHAAVLNYFDQTSGEWVLYNSWGDNDQELRYDEEDKNEDIQ